MTALDPVASRPPDRTGVRCPGQGAPSARETTIGQGFPPPDQPDKGRTATYRAGSQRELWLRRPLCYRRRQLRGAIWGIPVRPPLQGSLVGNREGPSGKSRIKAEGAKTMFRANFFLVLFLTVVLAALGNLVASAQQTAEIEDVKAANKAFYAAFSDRDLKGMEKVWSHDQSVRTIHPSSKEVLLGWEAVRKHWERVFARFEQISISMKDAQVRAGPEVAWVVGVEEFQARPTEEHRKVHGGAQVNLSVLATNAFEKVGDTWLMVHHHASFPAPATQ